MSVNAAQISQIIKDRIETFEAVAEARSEGTIVSVKDGIVTIYGLADVMYSEMIEFSTGEFGLALNLERDSVGAVVLGPDQGIVEGQGGTVLFVELLCGHATVLDRLESETRKKFGKLTDPDLYQQILAEGGFEYGGMPVPDLRINTERRVPAQAAGVIASALAARGLVS